ncbi:MAG TPA: hypothetical protein VGR21_10845 [Cryptosporangiaceae bacterium]|nr:hypothetical protein [Cryptosporangiaceae bacterium]
MGTTKSGAPIPAIVAVAYSAASVLLGPLIFALGFDLTRGGGDYCDLVYRQGDGWDPSREVEFRNAQVFHIAGAGFMLLVGLVILGVLAWNLLQKGADGRRRIQTAMATLDVAAALCVVFIMGGYVVLILSSGGGGQFCDP